MFLTRYSTNDLDRVFRHTVDLFDRMEQIFDDQAFSTSTTTSFPPHNIRKRDNSYLIEMAVAGFNRDEVNITREKNYLIVEGKKEEKNDDGFVYRGIANRSFKKSFALGENMKVLAADMKDGMLYVALEHEIPEEDKPVKIELGESSDVVSRVIDNVKKLIA
jgi:molecular chaperone IbpA